MVFFLSNWKFIDFENHEQLKVEKLTENRNQFTIFDELVLQKDESQKIPLAVIVSISLTTVGDIWAWTPGSVWGRDLRRVCTLTQGIDRGRSRHIKLDIRAHNNILGWIYMHSASTVLAEQLISRRLNDFGPLFLHGAWRMHSSHSGIMAARFSQGNSIVALLSNSPLLDESFLPKQFSLFWLSSVIPDW